MIFNEYLKLLDHIIISWFISILLYIISYIVDIGFFLFQKDFEKNSTYECGFQPFSDALNTFDIRFYLISILFIIFDLEVVFLLPWSISFYTMDCFSFCTFLLFLFVLTLGFFYEWFKGALDWQ